MSPETVETARLKRARKTAEQQLLDSRAPGGHWVGELSSSALSTATALFAIERVDLPVPPGAEGTNFEYPRGLDYLGGIRATVYWERGGQAFSESFETLVSPGKLYQPREPGL